MKLLIAIVNNDDSAVVASALTKENFVVTKLSTTGGFLMVGNTTFLIGTSDEDAQKAVEILKKYCTSRRRVQASTSSFGMGLGNMSLPAEITVGGATVFVLDVAQMEKF